MKYVILFFLLCQARIAVAQKQSINIDLLDKWPSVSKPSISDDANYVSYAIEKHPVGSHTLIIQSNLGSWRKELVGATPITFSTDSKQFIFQIKDTLCFLELGTNNIEKVCNVISSKYCTYGNGWIAYLLNNSDKELILLNMVTKATFSYPNVTEYVFNSKGTILLLESEFLQGYQTLSSLNWVNLGSGTNTTIWSGSKSDSINVKNYSFDNSGRKLAFIVQRDTEGDKVNSLMFYNDEMQSSVVLLGDRTIDSDIFLTDNVPVFSTNSKWIFVKFGSKEIGKTKQAKASANVDVWTYRDVTLQSEQLHKTDPRIFTGVINSEGGGLMRVEQRDEQVRMDLSKTDYVITSNNFQIESSTNEYWWYNYKPQSFHIISLQDGAKKIITQKFRPSLSVSPGGKYVVYFDRKRRHYFSYETSTGVTRNITYNIPVQLSQELEKFDTRDPGPIGIGGWFGDDSALFIYDKYDIWKVDPSTNKLPVNITNGFGRRHNIIFRVVKEKWIDGSSTQGKELLLTAFNTLNKYNGFYKKRLDRKENPELLSMGPYNFYRIQTTRNGIVKELSRTFLPIKARNVDCWIVQRMSVAEYPNYFLTYDFKSYIPLSNLQPQNKYLWVTAELMTWKQENGVLCQGILYKPENFNPKKKYPVLFNFYENMSDRLFDYPELGFSKGDINIPWFVSNGYLVFTPDIHYTIGETGESAYNSIISAAKYLSKYKWADGTKMGLQGHSFGAYEVNYIITRTNRFAAAVAAAGSSNLISHYGSLRLWGISAQYMFESNQVRIGSTLWQNPQLYIKNSPIFKADKVETPLLIMHNRNDFHVPWQQGIEWFTALRRLRKKAWLLQYDGEGHILLNSINAKDYTIRLMQFFNHYLMDALPPKWMTEGVPARLKGIESGYEFDQQDSIP